MICRFCPSASREAAFCLATLTAAIQHAFCACNLKCCWDGARRPLLRGAAGGAAVARMNARALAASFARVAAVARAGTTALQSAQADWEGLLEYGAAGAPRPCLHQAPAWRLRVLVGRWGARLWAPGCHRSARAMHELAGSRAAGGHTSAGALPPCRPTPVQASCFD